MRKLMWFTIGFSVACAVGAYVAFGMWLLLLTLVLFGVVCLAVGVKSIAGRRMLCALLGCLVGLIWYWRYDAQYLKPIRTMDGQAMQLSIVVTDYSMPTQYGVTAEGKAEISGKTYSLQFYYNEDVKLAPGDRVEGGFRLRYTGGGSEKPTYHRGNGVFVLCYPKGTATVTFGKDMPVRYFANGLRQRILFLLDALFPADTASFAKALLLGDTRGLGYETATAMKIAGVYHIAAVSGMHVSILFALVYLLCGKKNVLTAIIGLPVLFLFAAVAGFSPSVVRACIMQGLMVVALLSNKEYDPPTALAAAVLTILACNPLSITSVSLQLSAGCMVGIFLFSSRIHDFLLKETRLGPAKGKSVKARLTRWAVGSVSMTLGAISLTTPLSALYFGNISLVGIASNLLILWLITAIFYICLAACALGALWLPVGIGIGWMISWPIRGIIWVITMISKLPVSAVYTSSIYIVAWLIFCYVLITVFLKSKKKHPVVLTCCLIAGLIGAVACSWLEPRLDDYRVTAVDVGQGQCLILQKQGKYYMVDCGGDSGDVAADKASQLLLSQGVFRLDGLILTHYDADHAGGAQQLLSRIPADVIYLPILEEDNELRDTLVQQYGNRICWVEEDLFLKDSAITILPSENREDDNESSLCILFQPENCDILITGDRSEAGEMELLSHTELPDLEILVAGHHGSRSSTSWELLQVTRPELVIISVGADNRYGHPTWETLQRLELFGCKIYRTDKLGTIIFRG